VEKIMRGNARRMLGLDGPSYVASTRRIEMVAMSRG